MTRNDTPPPPPTPGERTPGDAIRDLREQRGMSLREAGRRAGSALSYQQIRNLENMPGAWDGVTFGTLRALASIYGVTVDHISRIALGRDPTQDAATKHEIHPDWVRLPAVPARLANDEQPDTTAVALIPRSHLERASLDPDRLRVFILDGDTLITSEAQRAEKHPKPGDYCAVDVSRKPEPGDVTAASLEGGNLVLYREGIDTPPHRAAPLAGGTERDVTGERTLGPVVWRGG